MNEEELYKIWVNAVLIGLAVNAPEKLPKSFNDCKKVVFFDEMNEIFSKSE